MNIGERMKLRRKQLKISADEIADQLGVSRSTIFRYEKGEIEKVPTDRLATIAHILKTTPEELMGWNNRENLSSIETIYNQLNKTNQEKVYFFAEKKLEEQKKIVELPNFDHVETLAAHSSDPNKTFDEKEIDDINSYLDKLDKEFDSKNNK